MANLLHFTSTALTLAYFATCFLASLGALQIVATREGLAGLALIRPASSWTAYGLGVALIAAPMAWFFTTQHELIFQPGLAGSELFIILGLAAALALAVALAVANLRQRPVPRPITTKAGPVPADPASTTSQVEAVTFGQAEFAGRLYRPMQGTEPHPVACVVPSPLDDPWALDPLAEALAAAGWVALVVDWSADTELQYPEVLAVLPAAISSLGRRTEVDGGRIALVGYDLGADLALRAASSDESVQAVVALAPLLGEGVSNFGLGVLSEWSYRQAWQRTWTTRRLLVELDPLGRLRHLADRPVLVVYGDRDRLVDVGKAQAALREAASGCRVDLLPGAGHRDIGQSRQAAQWICRWLEEHV
jgi:dienelactone hydrolase